MTICTKCGATNDGRIAGLDNCRERDPKEDHNFATASVVTLSKESLVALAQALERGRSEHSSFISTPLNPLSEAVDNTEEADVDASYRSMVLYKQARHDTKRYSKLFKKHLLRHNCHYAVEVTVQHITVMRESAGVSTTVGEYPYKAGVAKALWAQLSLAGFNAAKMLQHFTDNGFQAFSDAEYLLAAQTSDPPLEL